MPRPKPILALACIAAAAAIAGCGSDKQPEPSIPAENSQTLLATLQEVQANVDNGSCVVAQTKAQEFNDELSQLPASVNQDVVEALQRGTLNLAGLISEQCDSGQDTTTDTDTSTQDTETKETTTQDTTTETQPTTTTPPTTTTTPPPNTGGGGVGPPGSDGL